MSVSEFLPLQSRCSLVGVKEGIDANQTRDREWRWCFVINLCIKIDNNFYLLIEENDF